MLGPAAASDEEPQVFDLERALWVTGGNRSMMQRATGIFLKHMPQRFEELRAAAQQSNTEEIQRLAHSIKGAAASIGGERLRAAALELEECARNQDSRELPALHQTMQTEFSLLTKAIQDFNQELNGENAQQ